MRVLWVCNVLPPLVAEKLNKTGSNKEGWISGALKRILKDADNGETDIELTIAYPVSSIADEQDGRVQFDNGYRVNVCGYYEDQTRPEDYCMSMENRFSKIIDTFSPYIIHVFGTEFGHTLAVAIVVKEKEKESGQAPKLLIGLQGIISKCGEEYTADLPAEIVNSRTFRDLIKKDNIAMQQAKFLERGEMEIRALMLSDNVTGRTAFDKRCIERINRKATYFHMNETLRESFYIGTWDINECKKHSIFVSQADYPIKGFHILLDAMPSILSRYPDATIRVAGANIIAYDTFKAKLKIGGYGKYLMTLIHAYGLEGKVEFLGRLNEEQMKEEYLRCHTYVCPSSLENSPNSMGEAMLLGVPVVASRVGGIPSMIEEDEEGKLFEMGNAEGLADDIMSIWKDDAKAMLLGAAAMNRAHLTHDADANYLRLMEIYETLVNN